MGAMRVVETPAEVAAAGGWVLERTHGWAVVHSLVPERFDAYARVFHPAARECEERDLPLPFSQTSRTGRLVRAGAHGVAWCEVSWSEVARANGKVAHPAMEWTAITGSYEYSWDGMQYGLWDEVPQRGSLPLRLTRRLGDALASFTRTPERCWCAMWEGDGDMVGLRSDERLPRLAMRGRGMILASGPLARVTEKSFDDGFVTLAGEDGIDDDLYQSPSLWWPDDRAWCVATDVDLQTTYLGGSHELVEHLLNDAQLEVMRASAAQDVSLEADTVNPTPTGDRTKA
jgi:hypothetical protein